MFYSYAPLLANGKPVPLTWPMLLFRYINVISWPLEDNLSWWSRGVSYFLYLVTALVYLLHLEAESRYLYVNMKDIDELLTGIPTLFILVETTIRVYSASLYREKFKRILKKFYAEIYVDENENPVMYRKIHRQYYPTLIYSVLYLCALVSYIMAAIYFLVSGMRETAYKMILPFDITPIHIYVLTLCSNVWAGTMVTITVVGEAYTLAMFVFHLNGRYNLMRDNFYAKVDKLLKSKERATLAGRYNQALKETLQENLRLNTFAQEIQDAFSLRVFVIYAFIAATLCSLGFKVYTNPTTSISFVVWAMAKIQEILAFCQVGTSIITTTDNISSMYYESQWESVIARSKDSKANVRLMKLVNLAILTNSKPFQLMGLQFFNVSLPSAVTILQGTFSYFTCLTSLR